METVKDININELFSPKTKLLILLSKITRKNKILKDDIFEELLDINSALCIIKDYSSEHSARTAINRFLDDLKEEKKIHLEIEKGKEFVVVNCDIPNLNVMKLDKVFSNHIVILTLIISFIMFAIAFTLADIKLLVYSVAQMILIGAIYFSYKTKIII